MPNATNERLRQILSSETNLADLFIIKALERILLELDVNAEDEILDDMLPSAPNTQLVMFGHEIGVYSGLNRTTLKAKFKRDGINPLTDADVDAIFTALGVTTGTAFGGPQAAAAPSKEEDAEEKPKASASPKKAAAKKDEDKEKE